MDARYCSGIFANIVTTLFLSCHDSLQNMLMRRLHGRYWARLFKKGYNIYEGVRKALVAGGRRGTRVRKTAGWGGNLARSKGAAIFAPEARSCANWKSHLSFNKGTGRGGL